MSSLDLRALQAKTLRLGWTTTQGSLDQVPREAQRLGWEVVPTRPGEDAIGTLKPATTTNANPKSLSAVYGLNAQPLHTDGAHLAQPPDLVFLHATVPNETPTLLWSKKLDLHAASPHLHHPPPGGIFLVHGASEPFLTGAHIHGFKWRYDPGCMSACDQRARALSEFLIQAATRAYQHSWSKADMLLVIDNKAALHGRAAVADGDQNREIRRVAVRMKKQ